MYNIVKTPDALNSFVEEFKDLFTKPVRSSRIRRLYWIAEEFEKYGHNDQNNSPR